MLKSGSWCVACWNAGNRFRRKDVHAKISLGLKRPLILSENNPFCQEGMLELGIWKVHHLSAMALLWFGTCMFPQTKAVWCPQVLVWWPFSDSSVFPTKEKFLCFGQNPSVSHRFAGWAPGRQHLCSRCTCYMSYDEYIHRLTIPKTHMYTHTLRTARLGVESAPSF